LRARQGNSRGLVATIKLALGAMIFGWQSRVHQDDAVLAAVKAWPGEGGACGSPLSDGHP
jgi:hypothetical protein